MGGNLTQSYYTQRRKWKTEMNTRQATLKIRGYVEEITYSEIFRIQPMLA